MRSFICLSAGLILAITLLGHLVSYKIRKDVEIIKNRYEPHLGRKVLFKKDSVTIIDYEPFEEVFILSNGKRINYKLVK